MAGKIDLTDLSHFVRVAEKESFSAAARDLGVPTSTVSRSISRLEDALGVRLLERTTRKVVPTASGKALFGSVTGPLAALSEATETIAAFHDKPCGLVRVTVPIDLAPATAMLAADFMHAYPDVRVEVSSTNRYVDMVAEGFDVALRAGGRLADSSLVARKVGEMEAYVFASPTYVAKRGTPKTLRDVEAQKHDVVLFRGKDGEEVWPLSNDGKRTSLAVRGRLGGDDYAFVLAACVAGAGLALIPEGLCRDDVKEGTLVRVLAPWARTGGALHVVVPSNKHLAPRVAAFRDYVLKHFFGRIGKRR